MNFKSKDEIAQISAIAQYLRLKAFETILVAKSGHIGASSSSAELMTALYFGSVLRYDPADPRHPGRDRVLVRGHLGPLRYNLFALLGWVQPDELPGYRSLGSRLQGHESMDVLPGVDITPSGSLGMLLSYGVGSSYALRVQNIDSVNYVFLGDGEEQEGNVSEAARHASSLKLNNLVCIIDQNGKQLSSPTDRADGKTNLAQVWAGYGWDVKIIQDGHNMSELLEVLNSPRSQTQPTLIIAQTKKGYGVQGNEAHYSGYHTLSTCGPDKLAEAVEYFATVVANNELSDGPIGDLVKQQLTRIPSLSAVPPIKPLVAEFDFHADPEAKSEKFVGALVSGLKQIVAKFGEPNMPRLYMLTADWSNQDQIKKCGLDSPWINYIDVGIREQHMMAMAHGISVTDRSAKVFIFDGDGFAYRGSDQLHAMAQAKTPVVIIGTDGGLCEAKNGSTHQSAGQPGMLAHMPNLTLLEPATEDDFFTCLNFGFNNKSGPVYLRVHSGEFADTSFAKNRSAYRFYEPDATVRLNLVTSGLLIKEADIFAKTADTELGIGINVINVVAMQELDHEFVALLDPNVPTVVFFNGMKTVLNGFVTQALLDHGGWNQPVKSFGFTVGTTGDLSDLLGYYLLDSYGMKTVAESAFSNV